MITVDDTVKTFLYPFCSQLQPVSEFKIFKSVFVPRYT